MPAPDSPDAAPVRLEFSAELIREGIALGVQRALADVAAGEFRRFLEEYFDCLDAEEAAAFFGVSERTIQQLWQDGKIPKDTALGSKLPRTSLRALKELLPASRIKARPNSAPKLRAMAHPNAA